MQAVVAPADRHRVRAEFDAAVNMSADELRLWLETKESRSVGWRGAQGLLQESVGHASGRWIADILSSDSDDLTDEDYAQMRRAVGFIRRHLAQEPVNVATSRWRYSLMNWGHDPLRSGTGDACLARRSIRGAGKTPGSDRHGGESRR
jgi:hypothetical protein